jgi:hypothetical protein
MIVFVALVHVIDNSDARAALERTFSTVLVASARDHAVTELTALGDTVDAAVIGVRNASTPTCWPPEIIDSDGLRAVVAEQPDLRFAVDDFGLVDDGTVAIVGDRGLWSPHVADVTVEASAAMDDVVVPGWCKRLPAGRCGEMQRVDPGMHGSVVSEDHGGRVGEVQGGHVLLNLLHSVTSAFQCSGGVVGEPVVE